MSSSATVRQKYEQTEIYDQLVDEYGIFDSYVDMFVFAASIGYANDRCVITDYGGDEEMLWMHFSDKELYKAVAASIAYQHHDDPEALLDTEMQLETLTMYAAAGADILEKKFGDLKGDPTDAVLNYIQEWDQKDDTEARQTVLGEIMSSFDQNMQSTESAKQGN